MIDADELGRMRRSVHLNQGNKRFFSDSTQEDRIGAAGEIEFAKRYELEVNTTLLEYGDDHIDFKTSIGTIDIKTYRKPYNLLVKEKEMLVCADIIVLALYKEDKTVEFLGWERKEIMSQMPIKDFGYGIRNYYRHASKLKPMKDLDKLLGKNE